MPTFLSRRALIVTTTATLLVLLAVLVLGACGGSASPASTIATTISSVATATSASPVSSAGVPAGSVPAGSGSVTSATQPGETTTSAGGTTASAGASTTTTVRVTTTTAAPSTTTAKPTTTAAKGPVVLKVTGPSGVKELSMADLKAMPASSGYGGWKNDVQNISGPYAFKGVSLRALMDLVGGGSSVTVVASDGYSRTLSGGELGGSMTMFDPATGEEIQSISGSLRAVVAYSKDGAALNSEEGPLRLVFISPEKDQVTQSKLWVRMVTELQVQ